MSLPTYFVQIPCPNCRFQLDVQVIDIVLDTRVYCPCCKWLIQMKHDGGDFEQAIRAFERLMNTVENTNITISIKL